MIPAGIPKSKSKSGAGKAFGTIGKVTNALSIYDTAKQGFGNAKQEWQTGINPYDSILNSKIAADQSYMKTLGDAAQSGLQKGIKALPVTGGVLAASYLVNRNLKGDMAPVRPSNSDIKNAVRYKMHQSKKKIEKEAAEFKHEPWKEFGKNLVKNAPAHAVEGVTMALPAAAITLALGKNIRGRGETIPTRRPEYKAKVLAQKYNKRTDDT